MERNCEVLVLFKVDISRLHCGISLFQHCHIFLSSVKIGLSLESYFCFKLHYILYLNIPTRSREKVIRILRFLKSLSYKNYCFDLILSIFSKLATLICLLFLCFIRKDSSPSL